jgi:hypothetical protein
VLDVAECDKKLAASLVNVWLKKRFSEPPALGPGA